MIPSLNIRRLSIRLPRVTFLILVTYLLLYANILNIANYSFLSYTFSGGNTSNPIFELLKYSRLPVMLIGGLIFTIGLLQDKKLRTFCLQNIDLFLFLMAMGLGLINSIDHINGVFYTIWQSAALITILLFIYHLKKSKIQLDSVRFLLQLLFWSNFIVLPLLLLNIRSLGSDWSYYMAFSSTTFYPYCLLSLLISIYGCRVLTQRSLFTSSPSRNKLYELICICLLILFCFISARRTPLILMILLSIPYLYIMIGKRVWKKAMLVTSIIIAILISIPIAQSYVEEHKYELAILKKLNDLVQSEGDVTQDASYNERILVWNSYWKVFQKNKIVGVGAYNSGLVQSKMFAGSSVAGLSTHNLYLGILVEHGILGFCLFMFIILKSIATLLLRAPFDFFIKYVGFLIIPVLLINWNEYNLIPGQVFYWTTVLVLIFPRIYLLKS